MLITFKSFQFPYMFKVELNNWSFCAVLIVLEMQMVVTNRSKRLCWLCKKGEKKKSCWIIFSTQHVCDFGWKMTLLVLFKTNFYFRWHIYRKCRYFVRKSLVVNYFDITPKSRFCLKTLIKYSLLVSSSFWLL